MVRDSGIQWSTVELRVCVDCLRGRTFAEVLAVALDRRLEGRRVT